jgi:cytosine deaminase
MNHLEVLKKKIINNGGFSNSHAHLDRAYTVDLSEANTVGNKHLFEKWMLVDQFKRNATIEDYFKNISRALDTQLKYGVTKLTTFIDLDTVVGEKAITAAEACREISEDKFGISLKLASQTLKGVLKKEERNLFEKNIDRFDVIGSLPRADDDTEAHLDYLMDIAKQTKKKLHVHVDQLNTIEEKETELLARLTMKHGLEGMVTAVHSISLACHPKKYREEVYRMSRDAGISFISCPTAWIDARRSEALTVTHNAITPVDEMINFNLNICIGSDNIFDIYKPFSDGDMMTELRFLLECTHFYDIDKLASIASTNYDRTV